MTKKITSYIVIAALLLISSFAYAAEYSNPQLLVTPADIEKNKGKWIVIDCRDEKAYAAGHIPDAINLGGPCAKVLRDTTLRIKKTSELENILGEAGLSMDKPVVVYADFKLLTGATITFWILEYLGHENVRYLNGGIEAWQADGKTLDKTETKLPPAAFKAKVVKSRLATTNEVVKMAKGEIKDLQLIDSRTVKENKGDDIRSLRGGCIPNTTINVSHADTYTKSGRMLSMEALGVYFGTLDKNKRTIAYCQTGSRSTLTYLELRLMGFKDPANYDDSWIVYGSNPDNPAANENWYDFVKVNDTVKTVEELKKEIEELKKK